MALVFFRKDTDTLRVSLNRTQALNAINSSLLQELEQGLRQYEKDETISALVLSGEGGCFASGADIEELAGLEEGGIREFHRLRERTFSLLEDFPAPTVAVIEKYALGTGLELALCCDLRIASADARLGVPSARLGLVESYEYFSRLLRAVGPSWAKKMVFTGDLLEAQTALQIKLVEEVSPADTILERTESLLSRMRQNSLPAIRQTKNVMAACRKDPNLLQAPDPALPLVESMKSADFRAATRTFLEKRRKREGH